MKKNIPIILALVILTSTLAVLDTSCAKHMPSIGKGDVTGEFKQCLDLNNRRKYEEAIQCMEMFKARYPKTNEGQEAELRIGDAQFAKKDYLIAAESYLAFLRLYPSHPKADYAHFRAGVSYFNESPKAIDRDQEYLDNAIDELKTVVRYYPNSEYNDAARLSLLAALRRVARRHLYIGKFYYRTGEYIASIPRFKDVYENYPETGMADEALYLATNANVKLGRLDDARELYGVLSVKFPNSHFTKKAEIKLMAAARKATK